MKRYLLYTAVCCFLLAGTLFTIIYSYEVWEVLGKDDMSIIYWHLPILFLGFGAFGMAGWLYRQGRNA